MDTPHHPAAARDPERAAARAAAGPLADQLLELATITGGLAHEIRNPLSTLKVNLQLLDEDWRQLESAQTAAAGPSDARGPHAPGAAPPDARDIARRSRRRLTTLLGEAQRLERILEDFLQYVGKRELKPAPADLNEIVRELVDFYEPQAAAHGVQLGVALADRPLVRPVDRMVLKEALLNLLINAQQAMDGGGRIDVHVAEAPGGAARIDIDDTGPGVPEEIRERIFLPYFSTKKGGSGLGLATARQIVRQHGGTLTVEPRPTGGSRFSLVLPA